MPAVSKRQAGLMGLVISGRKKVRGLSKTRAREMLRGTKVSRLPTRARRRRRRRR